MGCYQVMGAGFEEELRVPHVSSSLMITSAPVRWLVRESVRGRGSERRERARINFVPARAPGSARGAPRVAGSGLLGPAAAEGCAAPDRADPTAPGETAPGAQRAAAMGTLGKAREAPR